MIPNESCAFFDVIKQNNVVDRHFFLANSNSWNNQEQDQSGEKTMIWIDDEMNEEEELRNIM